MHQAFIWMEMKAALAIFESTTNTRSNIIVYPNPATSNTNVDLKTIGSAKNIMIMDIQGRVIKTVPIKGNSTKLDISDFSNGIYFIDIEAKEQFGRIKLIKK